MHFFWDFDRFLTIFGQPVIWEPPNLALFYFILSSSELIWSFTIGHLSVNSVRSAPSTAAHPALPKSGGAEGAQKKEETLS